MQSDRSRTIVVLSCLTIITWAVFGNSLINGFVWDDALFILDNPLYKNFEIKKIFTTLANGLEFLPVRDISYAIDYNIGQGRPLVFHVSNLIIYTLVVFSVFFYARVLYRLLFPMNKDGEYSTSMVVAAVTALMFAVHPIHCEPVNFVTCRNALLSTLFFFVSGTLFLRIFSVPETRWKTGIRYLVALAAFVASIFSKANSIILPFILLLLSCYTVRTRRLRTAVSTLPFIGVAVGGFYLLISIAFKAAIISDRVEDWTLNGCITKLAKAFQIPLFYLGKLIYPHGLSASYDTVFAWSPSTPSVIAAAVALVIAFAASTRIRTNHPYVLFCLCWYLLALLPVLNFFVTMPVVADRYILLPSFAFYFLLACAGVQLASRVGWRIMAITSAGIVVYWSLVAVEQNRVWFSDETLWTAAIRTSPNDSKGYRNLGNLYLEQGNYQKALQYFEHVKDYDPAYFLTLGLLAFNAGKLQEAKELFSKSIGRDIKYTEAIYYLGLVYEQTGQPDVAAELYAQAVRMPKANGGYFSAQAAERLKTLTERP